MTTASSLSVRNATAGDAERICALAGQLGYPGTVAETESRVRDVLASDEHGVLVAEVDGNVVGWIHVTVLSSVLQDKSVEIVGLVVDEQHRSRGIGRLLVDKAEQWAAQKSCRVIRVRSNVIRERAHEFYERLGYEVVKTQKAFRKQLAH